MALNQSTRNARGTSTTEPRPPDDAAVLFEEVQQALCEDGFASPPEGRPSRNGFGANSAKPSET